MTTLVELKKDIAASLYIKPTNYNELIERDFLKNISEYGIDVLLRDLLADNWCYQKGETYYTYKKAVEDNLEEYDLL